MQQHAATALPEGTIFGMYFPGRKKKLKPSTVAVAAAVRTKPSYIHNNSRSFPRSFITCTQTHICVRILPVNRRFDFRRPRGCCGGGDGKPCTRITCTQCATTLTSYYYATRTSLVKTSECLRWAVTAARACYVRAWAWNRKNTISRLFSFFFPSSYLEKDLEGTI